MKLNTPWFWEERSGMGRCWKYVFHNNKTIKLSPHFFFVLQALGQLRPPKQQFLLTDCSSRSPAPEDLPAPLIRTGTN